MARLEFGLSDFLFGSRSALCGSKHGIPRRPPADTYASKCLRVRLVKTEHRANPFTAPNPPQSPASRQAPDILQLSLFLQFFSRATASASQVFVK